MTVVYNDTTHTCEQFLNIRVSLGFVFVCLFRFSIFRVFVLAKIITGPPTHSVGGQTSNGRWCLSSVGVCRL